MASVRRPTSRRERTVRRRTRRGPRRSRASRPRHRDAGAADGRRAGRSSRSAGRCSAPSTASSRCGGRGAGRAARPDRAARRRLRPRLRLDGRRRAARVRGPLPTLPQGRNPVRPTSRSRGSRTCCRPGGTLEYNGERAHPSRHPPRLLGGREPVPPPPGPVRLRRAFARPDTVIVQRAVLDRDGPARRHRVPGRRRRSSATISAPAATTAYIIAMPRALDAVRRAARRLRDPRRARRAVRRARTRSPKAGTAFDWVAHLYERVRARAVDRPASTFPSSRSSGSTARLGCRRPSEHHAHVLRVPRRSRAHTRCRRRAAGSNSSRRRSTRFGYDECPGHPAWIEPDEWLGSPAAGRFPLALVANQPATRLHGQLEGGGAARPRRSPDGSRSASIPTTPRPRYPRR